MTAEFWETWPTLDGPSQWTAWFEQVQTYARRNDVWCHLDPDSAASGPAATHPPKPTSPQSRKQGQILRQVSIAISKTVAPRYANQVCALKSPSAAVWWLRITLSPSAESREEARAAARVWHLVTQRGERDWRAWSFELRASWRQCKEYKAPFLNEKDMTDEFLQSVQISLSEDSHTFDRYLDWYRPVPRYLVPLDLDWLIRDFEVGCEIQLAGREADRRQQATKGNSRRENFQSLRRQWQLQQQGPVEEEDTISVKEKANKSKYPWWKNRPPCPGCGVGHSGNHQVWWESCWIFREMHLEECARVKTRAVSIRVRESRESSVTTRLQIHIEEKEAAYSWLKCQGEENDKRDDAGNAERCKELQELTAGEREDEAVKVKDGQLMAQKAKQKEKIAETGLKTEEAEKVKTKKSPKKRRWTKVATRVKPAGRTGDEEVFSEGGKEDHYADTTLPPTVFTPQYRPDTRIAWMGGGFGKDPITQGKQKLNGEAGKKQVKKEAIKDGMKAGVQKDEIEKDETKTEKLKNEEKPDEASESEIKTDKPNKDKTRKDEIRKDGVDKIDAEKSKIENKTNGQDRKDEEKTNGVERKETKDDVTVEIKNDKIKTDEMAKRDLGKEEREKIKAHGTEMRKEESKKSSSEEGRLAFDASSSPDRSGAGSAAPPQSTLKCQPNLGKKESGGTTQRRVGKNDREEGETDGGEGSRRTANDGSLEDEVAPATPIDVPIKLQDSGTKPESKPVEAHRNGILRLQSPEAATRETSLVHAPAKPFEPILPPHIADGPPYDHIDSPDPHILADRFRAAVVLSTETSVHIFNDRAFFQADFAPGPCARQTILKAGEALAPLGSGSVTLATGPRGMSITLSGCFYVPGLRASCVSARGLLGDGYVWAVSRGEIYAVPDRLAGHVVSDHDLESYVLARLDLRREAEQ